MPMIETCQQNVDSIKDVASTTDVAVVDSAALLSMVAVVSVVSISIRRFTSLFFLLGFN